MSSKEEKEEIIVVTLESWLSNNSRAVLPMLKTWLDKNNYNYTAKYDFLDFAIKLSLKSSDLDDFILIFYTRILPKINTVHSLQMYATIDTDDCYGKILAHVKSCRLDPTLYSVIVAELKYLDKCAGLLCYVLTYCTNSKTTKIFDDFMCNVVANDKMNLVKPMMDNLHQDPAITRIISIENSKNIGLFLNLVSSTQPTNRTNTYMTISLKPADTVYNGMLLTSVNCNNLPIFIEIVKYIERCGLASVFQYIIHYCIIMCKYGVVNSEFLENLFLHCPSMVNYINIAYNNGNNMSRLLSDHIDDNNEEDFVLTPLYTLVVNKASVKFNTVAACNNSMNELTREDLLNIMIKNGCVLNKTCKQQLTSMSDVMYNKATNVLHLCCNLNNIILFKKIASELSDADLIKLINFKSVHYDTTLKATFENICTDSVVDLIKSNKIIELAEYIYERIGDENCNPKNLKHHCSIQ